MKVCNICGESKSLSEYYPTQFKSKTYPNKTYYHGKCKDCFIKKGQENYDPIKQRDKNLRHAYGITLDEYNVMLEKQGGVCGICKTDNPKGRQSGRGVVKDFYVDHNHETGEVRGLLCNNCNRAIGNFKDDPSIIQKAVLYLRS